MDRPRRSAVEVEKALKDFLDGELETELKRRVEERVRLAEETKKKREVIVNCPMCGGKGEVPTPNNSIYLGYPTECILCKGNRTIKAYKAF